MLWSPTRNPCVLGVRILNGYGHARVESDDGGRRTGSGVAFTLAIGGVGGEAGASGVVITGGGRVHGEDVGD